MRISKRPSYADQRQGRRGDDPIPICAPVYAWPLWRGALAGRDGHSSEGGEGAREHTHPFPPLAGTGKDEWLDKASPSVVSVAWSHETGAGIARASQQSYGQLRPPIPENSLGFVYLPAYPKLICSTTRRIRAAVAMRPRFYGIVLTTIRGSNPLASSDIPTRFPRSFQSFNCALPGQTRRKSPVKNETHTDVETVWASTAVSLSCPRRQCFARLLDIGLRSATNLPDWREGRKQNLHPPIPIYFYPRSRSTTNLFCVGKTANLLLNSKKDIDGIREA